MDSNEIQLSEFGEYLLRRKLVPEQAARFHVVWVRKFLAAAPEPALSLEDRQMRFLDAMRRAGSYQDWQIDQAERAIKLYFHAFQSAAQRSTEPIPAVLSASDGSVAKSEVLAALRSSLRVKHYSYRTEQTYADWIARLFEYLRDTDQELPGGRYVVKTQAVKDFITCLATRRRVGASTQNQAFRHRGRIFTLNIVARSFSSLGVVRDGRAVRPPACSMRRWQRAPGRGCPQSSASVPCPGSPPWLS